MKMVTLKTFDNYVQAHIILGYLQQHGIDAVLHDELSTTIIPALNSSTGGIKLRVRETEALVAIAALEQLAAEQIAKDICPNCGGNQLQLRVAAEPSGHFAQLLASLSFKDAPAALHHFCLDCKQHFNIG